MNLKMGSGENDKRKRASEIYGTIPSGLDLAYKQLAFQMERRKWIFEILENIAAKDFSKLSKATNNQIKEVQQIPSKIKSESDLGTLHSISIKTKENS